ncbi:MAG: DUF1697 domain-containing protein [Nanoarchaeota archaeon]|nr:DUF1697 domain-containing protein [Nanoarchaeota archaeon]
MDYVALLRGINVGGNNKISMKELKELFLSNNFSNVLTYINSGNVIFSDNSKKSINEIRNQIEFLIESKFGLKIKVLVVSKSKFKGIKSNIPENWTNDEINKTEILFLDSSVNNKEIMQKLPIKENVDLVIYVDGAIIWHIDRKNISKTGLIKLIGTKEYSNITVRNSNTVNKISNLLS